jgi:hypothetical protein
MSWTPLSDRLFHLPLILAGPILRRTEPDAVTVWVALRQACDVTLEVYATEGEGRSIDQLQMQGSRATISIGQHLHLVAVTARTTQQRLTPGQVYVYDLKFQRSTVGNPSESEPWSLPQALNSMALPRMSVSYFDHQLPSFCLPPDDLNYLRIVHGSCRKAHGGARDALPILDDLLEQHCTIAQTRPHQLFLTGDQIYGDEVADPLLMALTDAGDTLLGWQEALPIDPALHSGVAPLLPCHLLPGQRSQVAEDIGGFTAGLYDQPECAKSHLFGFGEYCATYLFAWSPVLWTDFPGANAVGRSSKAAKTWEQERQIIETFAQTLGKVRRALANIATYMIFDDHDVTDDWYLNREWCLRVLSKSLGRRSVQNGMLAYALFQGWGNRPEDFEAGARGESLLLAAQRGAAAEGTDQAAETDIARYLGIPDRDATGIPLFRLDGQVLILDRSKEALEWNYVVRGPRYEVIVLDTRTWRGYPADQPTNAPPMLLSPTAFDRQLRQTMQSSRQRRQTEQFPLEATLVVAPTNLVSLEAIDWVQTWNLKQGKTFHNDVGDAWNINKHAFSKLLNTLFEQRDRIIVLSGDIHYGSTVCLHYWSRQLENDRVDLLQADRVQPDRSEKPHVLVQLTSSAIKNAELKTRIVHTKIKSLVAEKPQDWAGWTQPVELLKVRSFLGFRSTKPLPPPAHLPDVQRLHRTHGNLAWDIAVRQPQAFPNWRYHIEWIKRQPAQRVSVRSSLSTRPPQTWLHRLTHWFVQHFWHNRWLQEGREVVGLNNIGLVQFHWSAQSETYLVHHDLHWYAPWEPGTVVYSRYTVPLDLELPPPALPIVQPISQTKRKIPPIP